MADFNAIADALAVRFSAANITPPSGEQDIRNATAALPQTITVEPTVLVFPPVGEFNFMASTRTGICVYPVRFYIHRVRDNARNSTLCNKWLSSLYDQLTAQYDLGLSGGGVTHAVVRSFTVGELTYSGESFMGIQLDAEVHIAEPLNASTS